MIKNLATPDVIFPRCVIIQSSPKLMFERLIFMVTTGLCFCKFCSSRSSRPRLSAAVLPPLLNVEKCAAAICIIFQVTTNITSGLIDRDSMGKYVHEVASSA